MRPKETVVAFLRAFWAADEAAWEVYLAPDARFWFAPSMSYALEAGRDWDARTALRRLVADLFTAFSPETGLQVELTGAIAEGDEVAVDYTASGLGHNGKRYINYYLMRASVRGGLIVKLVPYSDTRQIDLLLDEG